MSLEDTRIQPIEIDFEGEKLKLEFDNSALAYLQENTGKGPLKIRKLILTDNLFYQDSIVVFKAALLKHHSPEIIKEVEAKILENIYLIIKYNAPITNSFMKMVIAPEIYKKVVGEQDDNQSEEDTPEKKLTKKSKTK